MDTQKNSATNTLDLSAKQPVHYGEPVDILVVEDNDSERESIVLALQNSIPDVVVAVGDGVEALGFCPSVEAIRP